MKNRVLVATKAVNWHVIATLLREKYGKKVDIQLCPIADKEIKNFVGNNQNLIHPVFLVEGEITDGQYGSKMVEELKASGFEFGMIERVSGAGDNWIIKIYNEIVNKKTALFGRK